MSGGRYAQLRTLTLDRGGDTQPVDKRFPRFSPHALYGATLFAKLLVAFLIFTLLFVASEAKAGIASGFSYTLGEEYNDNIFFSNEKNKRNERDFITHFVPTFTFLYAPPSETVPTLTASLSTEGQIFAHHGDLSNFGQNLSFDAGYTYRYSPRLTFHAADTATRGNGTRTIGLEALGPPPQLPGTPTMFPATGAFIPLPLYQDIGSLLTEGKTAANYFSVEGAYLYSPNFTMSGGYAAGYSNFDGGSEISHSIGIRGSYNWAQLHNLHAGFTVTFTNGNNGNGGGKHNGGSNVYYNIDIGDDYFSLLKIQLTPTLTLSGSAGIGLNTTGDGPGIVATGGLTLIKIWETATFNIAAQRGLTPSFGLSGLSLTTSVSSGFGIRFTERLTGTLGVDYSFFDTQDDDVKVFRAGGGLQYWITPWLSSNLMYSHRWRDSGTLNTGGGGCNKNSNCSLTAGQVAGNSIFLGLSVHFDVWPNLSLARGAMQPLYPPMGAPLYAPAEFQQPVIRPAPVPSQSPTSQ
jgi:hypothetical protein